MQSFGGFITNSYMDNEYYSESYEYSLLRLNLARYGITESFFDSGLKKLYIPLYICPSVIESLKKYKIAYELYHIDDKLEPLIDFISDEEQIVIVNYFGIKSKEFYERMIGKYKNIIFDNTQTFFTEPVLKDNVYNVYSPRKFFPVSDGAYMIAKSFNIEHKLEDDYSGKRAAYLLRAWEEGTNAVYDLFNDAEEELNASPALNMSKLTKDTLSAFDYEKIKAIRKRNLSFVRKMLDGINEFDLSILNDEYPMNYPLLIKDEKKRKSLIEKKVFISQWWKCVLDFEHNEIEDTLSRYLLPIPIDQRYTQIDLKEMCGRII